MQVARGVLRSSSGHESWLYLEKRGFIDVVKGLNQESGFYIDEMSLQAEREGLEPNARVINFKFVQTFFDNRGSTRVYRQRKQYLLSAHHNHYDWEERWILTIPPDPPESFGLMLSPSPCPPLGVVPSSYSYSCIARDDAGRGRCCALKHGNCI